MSTDLHMVERLRPQPEPLDSAWSAQTLGDILAQPGPRKRYRGRIVTGAAALVVVSAGGAYAAGWVPEFITQGFEQVSTGEVSSQQLLADVKLPDGRVVGIWTARDDDGDRCRAITEDWNGRNASPAAAFECGPNMPLVESLWTSGPSADGSGGDLAYLIVYGERPHESAHTVHIVGDGIDVRTSVDPTTGGFATRIPIPPEPITQARAPMMTVNFVDGSGTVTSSVDLDAE